MYNWLKNDLDYLLGTYKSDIEMISKKKKDEEWKRDHYRYASAIAFQRIINLLNTQITENTPAPLQASTKDEYIILRDMINSIVGKD